jgi:hypothetical protein
MSGPITTPEPSRNCGRVLMWTGILLFLAGVARAALG